MFWLAVINTVFFPLIRCVRPISVKICLLIEWLHFESTVWYLRTMNSKNLWNPFTFDKAMGFWRYLYKSVNSQYLIHVCIITKMYVNQRKIKISMKFFLHFISKSLLCRIKYTMRLWYMYFVFLGYWNAIRCSEILHFCVFFILIKLQNPYICVNSLNVFISDSCDTVLYNNTDLSSYIYVKVVNEDHFLWFWHIFCIAKYSAFLP